MDPNPLVPSAYAASPGDSRAVSLARSRASLTTTQTLAWVLLILRIPLLGAIAWLVAGRPRTPVPSTP